MVFSELSGKEFIEVLASNAPVPGGGGAAAYVGAIGTALGNMVGSLTVGKKKYAEVEADIIKLKEKATQLQTELLAYIDKDAEAFEPLSQAYGLPKDTPEEKESRAKIMEEALKTACKVPLEIMGKCCEGIDMIAEFAKKGSAIAISDAGCGAACLRAALQSASLNVFINTKLMADKVWAEEANSKANTMLTKYVAMADDIFQTVRERL